MNLRASARGGPGGRRRRTRVNPEAVDVELASIGDYAPADGRLFARLTPRQQEILQTAVDAGYYEVPRETTHDEIAAELDLAAPTVGEHLRKIEASVLSSIVPGTPTDE